VRDKGLGGEEDQEVITSKTADHISRVNGRLETINRCLKDGEKLVNADYVFRFRVENMPFNLAEYSFQIPSGRITPLLGEIKADIEAELDELNTLAVQEAQDQEAKNGTEVR